MKPPIIGASINCALIFMLYFTMINEWYDACTVECTNVIPTRTWQGTGSSVILDTKVKLGLLHCTKDCKNQLSIQCSSVAWGKLNCVDTSCLICYGL